jgi:hypothetical protein
MATRLLVSGAVVQTALVPSFTPNPPKLQKPAIRTGQQAPSSALAAQLLAQQDGLSEAELSIFIPIPPSDEQPEQAPEEAVVEVDSSDAAEPAAAAATAKSVIAQRSSATSAPRLALAVHNVNIGATGLPALATPQKPAFIKHAGLIQVRGNSAYQLAERRNHELSASTQRVEAIL